MNDFSSVKGKVAVITGAASGMGKAIAEIFAANGMSVVVADLNQERGDEVVENIRENGGEAVFCRANVSVEEDVKNLMKTAVDTYGKLNVVVNNAGVSNVMHPIHEYSAEEFRRLCDVNYIGVFFGMKYGVRAMLDTASKECTIINISSGDGLVTNAHMAAYDAPKRAVISLTQTAALDYARYDITSNVICPGAIDTDIYSHISPEQRTLTQSLIPNGRFGDPQEIAYMALFLASNMARYISGAAIAVDAGMTCGNYNELEWEKPYPRAAE